MLLSIVNKQQKAFVKKTRLKEEELKIKSKLNQKIYILFRR